MSEDEVLAEVVSRERQLLDPNIRRMDARVESLLHPGFIEYGASAVRLASNVVHVTYRVVNGSQSLRSSIWFANSPGEWRLRLHQGTPVPPE